MSTHYIDFRNDQTNLNINTFYMLMVHMQTCLLCAHSLDLRSAFFSHRPDLSRFGSPS